MSTPLLTTKLHVPPVRSELVRRPRFLERLNRGLDRKLTLIFASIHDTVDFLIEYLPPSIHLLLATLLVIWVSALASAVVVNNPLTAAIVTVMVFLTLTLPGAGKNVLYWGLALGQGWEATRPT